jgi:hypothetical protein
VGGAEEPGRQFVGVGGRQVGVADGLGQFDDGAGPQPTVEVVVEQHLRDVADRLDTQGDRHVTTLVPQAASE